jgi:hypothetical protein
MKPPPSSHLDVYGAQQPRQQEDLEDGITPAIEALLTERKGPLKVCTWGKLWETLFPNDAEIPLSGTCFHPPPP